MRQHCLWTVALAQYMPTCPRLGLYGYFRHSGMPCGLKTHGPKHRARFRGCSAASLSSGGRSLREIALDETPEKISFKGDRDYYRNVDPTESPQSGLWTKSGTRPGLQLGMTRFAA